MAKILCVLDLLSREEEEEEALLVEHPVWGFLVCFFVRLSFFKKDFVSLLFRITKFLETSLAIFVDDREEVLLQSSSNFPLSSMLRKASRLRIETILNLSYSTARQ